jgi:hypothetical protein
MWERRADETFFVEISHIGTASVKFRSCWNAFNVWTTSIVFDKPSSKQFVQEKWITIVS